MSLQDAHPEKEFPVNGVYRRDPDGALYLLVDGLTRPNRRVMYLSNSDAARKIWMRYEVSPGAVERPRLL